MEMHDAAYFAIPDPHRRYTGKQLSKFSGVTRLFYLIPVKKHSFHLISNMSWQNFSVPKRWPRLKFTDEAFWCLGS
jgi:hypothetical protein